MDLNRTGFLQTISKDQALFVLSDQGIYNLYHPSSRLGIDYIPFPGSAKQGWQIGSSLYLGLIADEDVRKETSAAGEIFISYLRSEDISERFLQKTGIHIFTDGDSESLIDIPSLTEKVQDNDMQELLEYLK